MLAALLGLGVDVGKEGGRLGGGGERESGERKGRGWLRTVPVEVAE